LGQRSRKRQRATGERAPAATAKPQRPPRPRVSGEKRDARVRAALEPLAPGQRPTAVTVAAIVAALLAVANLVMYLAGYKVKGASGKLGGLLIFEVLLITAAVGMWRARYWAVLGFETLLGITLLYVSLALTVASNWWAVLLCFAIIVPAGYLFWKLIRAMARIQMPTRKT
jgi:hypothetical protein